MKFCGTVAIAGRPNVGKSTLLNRLVGQKLSITAHKPQTTRHRILGIHSKDDHQVIYVDTPGIHVSGTRALNQVLNRTASNSLHDVDLVILLVQAMVWNDDDKRAFELVSRSKVPFIMAINKMDTVKHKSDLLPFLGQLPTDENLTEVMIISARKGGGVDALVSEVHKHVPEAAWQFDEDELTDRSSSFLAAEAVREQLTRLLSAELPYALSVEIESFEQDEKLISIGAVIWVDKPSQKGIVVGKAGERLKDIGTRSRSSLETLFGKKVFIKLWVRVKTGWADDAKALRSLGY